MHHSWSCLTSVRSHLRQANAAKWDLWWHNANQRCLSLNNANGMFCCLFCNAIMQFEFATAVITCLISQCWAKEKIPTRLHGERGTRLFEFVFCFFSVCLLVFVKPLSHPKSNPISVLLMAAVPNTSLSLPLNGHAVQEAWLLET